MTLSPVLAAGSAHFWAEIGVNVRGQSHITTKSLLLVKTNCLNIGSWDYPKPSQ